MIRRPPRSTHCISSAASDVYKRQGTRCQVPDTRYQIPDTRYQVPDTRLQIPGTRYRAAGRIGTSSRSGGNGPKSCAMCHNFSGGLTLSYHSRTILETLSYVWKCYFLEPLPCARANEARSSAPVPTTHGVTGPLLHTSRRSGVFFRVRAVSYTHLRAHET